MARAQRIVFVAPRFSPKGSAGGAETLLKQLALRAARDHRAVTFLTTCATDHRYWRNDVLPGRRSFDGLDVHFFPVDERDAHTAARIEEQMNRGLPLSDHEEEEWLRNSVHSAALYDYLRAHGDEFDAVVVGPYLFGVSYRAALIHPHKTLLVPCLHDEPFGKLRLMRRLFESVARILFNSEPEMALSRSLFQLPERRCHIVGMGIEPFEADPEAFAKRHGLQAPYVLYSGRREDGKGTPLLCDYMTAFRARTGRDVKLVFTGSGDIPASAELAPHILDVGFVSESEKHEAMAGAAAFVHPSVMESFGIVLLEAWMAQTPALVRADSVVLRWQCERANGGLWFRNYIEFELELTALLDRPALRKALGANGRKYVLREYSWKTIEARFFRALDEPFV